MTKSNETFEMPALRINDRVEISRDTTWNHPIPGTVYEVKSRGADIVAQVGGRAHLFRDSMYRGDPNIEKKPHLFADGNRGVFCLAQSELDQRELIAQMKFVLNHIGPKGTPPAKAVPIPINTVPIPVNTVPIPTDAVPIPKRRGRPPKQPETGLGSPAASQEGELVR